MMIITAIVIIVNTVIIYYSHNNNGDYYYYGIKTLFSNYLFTLFVFLYSCPFIIISVIVIVIVFTRDSRNCYSAS